MIQTLTRLEQLRATIAAWKREGLRVGFVPTMGNLHAGHYALVELARRHADKVVASIFVNPTQFGPNEDYARYPRTPDSDIQGLAEHRCDALFLPPVEQMYPFGTIGCVQMHVPGITDILCGAHRPGHFNGVAQVVARLFNMVQPDLAIFGQKDFQQLALIRKMVADMGYDIEIVGVPIVRAKDGLALSSRNGYLTAEQRKIAPALSKVMNSMAEQLLAKALTAEEIIALAEQALNDKGLRADDVQIRDADTLLELAETSKRAVILVAAWLGQARLIDNKVVELA